MTQIEKLTKRALKIAVHPIPRATLATRLLPSNPANGHRIIGKLVERGQLFKVANAVTPNGGEFIVAI